jgi:hypothetical protein
MDGETKTIFMVLYKKYYSFYMYMIIRNVQIALKSLGC